MGKKKSNDQTLKEAIDLLLETYKIKDKYLETSLLVQWEELMGKTIANRTTELYIRNKRLFIRLNSAPLKQELVQGRLKLIELINERIGAEIVVEVVFL